MRDGGLLVGADYVEGVDEGGGDDAGGDASDHCGACCPDS